MDFWKGTMHLCLLMEPQAVEKLIRIKIIYYRMVGENDNTPGLMAMAVLELLNRAQQVKKYQTIRLKASYI